jgi:hypothetical protein
MYMFCVSLSVTEKPHWRGSDYVWSYCSDIDFRGPIIRKR